MYVVSSHCLLERELCLYWESFKIRAQFEDVTISRNSVLESSNNSVRFLLDECGWQFSVTRVESSKLDHRRVCVGWLVWCWFSRLRGIICECVCDTVTMCVYLIVLQPTRVEVISKWADTTTILTTPLFLGRTCVYQHLQKQREHTQ